MGPDSVNNLTIWREAVGVVKEIYLLTKVWPKDELYGLTGQVRRAAVSIAANLAEGVGRGGAKEAARFARMALGSLYELDTLLHIAAEIGYTKCETIASLRERLSTLSRRIQASSVIRESGSSLLACDLWPVARGGLALVRAKWLQATGYKLQATGYRLQATSYHC